MGADKIQGLCLKFLPGRVASLPGAESVFRVKRKAVGDHEPWEQGVAITGWSGGHVGCSKFSMMGSGGGEIEDALLGCWG